LPTIEDAVKAGDFLAGGPEDIIEAIEGKRYDSLDGVMPHPARGSALKTSDHSVDERAACNYIAIQIAEGRDGF
jgi:hypothetical protein